MKHNKLIGPLLAAGALMGLAGTAQAVPAVVASASDAPRVIVMQPPPPPMMERAPGVREGYVWAPGHYEWRNGRYEWRPGYWVSERPGYIWEQARWIQRPDGSWYLAGNTWERRGPNGDRDGDGVANRYDRDRDGDGIPNRYDRGRNGPYGDRDGDGVSNRDDDYPNNPNRS